MRISVGQIYKFSQIRLQIWTQNDKAKCFFVRRGSDERGEGADWSSVTEADWAGNEVWRKKTSRQI